MVASRTPEQDARYDAAKRIFFDCTHPVTPSRGIMRLDGRDFRCCIDCYNAGQPAWRAARKAQLAERPNDCQRCGVKPHRYVVWGRYKLCGRCLTICKREHNAAVANAGALAFLASASGPLFGTAGWAGMEAPDGR